MVSRTGFSFVVALLLLPSGCAERRDPRDQAKEQPSRSVEKDKAYMGRPLNEVLEELKSKDPKVRLGAVTVLSHTPRKESVPGLCQALDDSEVRVAEEAAKGLRWIGPEAHAAVPILIRRLEDPPSEAFRKAAIEALGNIGPKAEAAVPLLVKLLPEKQTALETRQAAVSALGKLGPVAKAAVPALTDALADDGLESHAVTALIQMGPEARPAVPALSKRLRPEQPYWLDLVRFLAEVDPQAAKVAISDLRSLAASEPVRDKGIVNFRASQQRIEDAKKLLSRLESRKD